MTFSPHNISTSTFVNQNFSLQTLVIVPGHGPEALLWIIVDAFLLVAIVTGNSLSIAIIIRTRRRRIRNKKSKVKGPLQRTRSKCSNRKHPSETGPNGSEHKRNGPEEMARNCRGPSRSSCFVLSLAMSDLLVGLAMPFHMTFYIQGADREGSIRQDDGITLGEIEWTCLLRFILIALACSASACNLLAIAVDRYIAIVYPLHYNRYMNKRVAVGMIISCWVSALALSTVPAYWNRWNTATTCELDEIFTPQYITCVIPPLFSTVMVALTILYWRIGREARAKLSTFLGADGKGPPWRRCQSGKTYCPFTTPNDNQQTKGKIQNAQSNSNGTQDENSSEPSNRLTASGLLTQQSITQNQELQQTGCKSTSVEGNFVNYRDERQEEYYENISNFHILYRIEEESDIVDEDDELGSTSLNTTESSNGSQLKLIHHQTIQIEYNEEKPFDSSREEPLHKEQGNEMCTTISNEFSECFSKSNSINDLTLQPNDNVSSYFRPDDLTPKTKNASVSKTDKANAFEINKCPNKCIAKAIKNLKDHFHVITVGNDVITVGNDVITVGNDVITLGNNVKCSPYDRKVTAANDSWNNSCNINNIQKSDKKELVSPNMTDLVNDHHPKVTSKISQSNGSQTRFPRTVFQDFIASEDYDLKKIPDTQMNCNQESFKSREIILSINGLDLINDRSKNNLNDLKEEIENLSIIKAQSNIHNVDKINDLSTDLISRPILDLDNNVSTLEDSTTHDKDSKIQDNIFTTETTKYGDISDEEANKEKPCSNDFQTLSPLQKDKNEHNQFLKRRSSSCTSQDDLRGSTWNIRFPSLTSAGTTVRPLSKSTIVVLLVLGSFLLLWLPYIIVCALLVNGYHLPYNIYRATFSLAMSNSGLNPIIYGWKNAELKRVFLRFILKKWHTCRRKYMKEEQTMDSEMDSHDFTDASFSSQKF